MRIISITNQNPADYNYTEKTAFNAVESIAPFKVSAQKPLQYTPDSFEFRTNRKNLSFEGNPIQKLKNYKNYIMQFVKAQKYAYRLHKAIVASGRQDTFMLREFCIEPLEGLQHGIKVFDGLSMKDIQYMSENLHVIAVKRGCRNMCVHCYADAKPQHREMSWEDFTAITQGYKTLRKRFFGLDIFGKNNPVSQSHPIYRTTELFYDADCMDLAIKDKKGKVYDFIELTDELYNSLGRRTVFDTSGWSKNIPRMQQRAEKYAQHFSKPENMEKLEAFNLSFNVFNASYAASVKALAQGDYAKAKRLKNKYTDNIANALFTFTPLVDSPKFGILMRSFGSNAKNAKNFNQKAMADLRNDVLNKLQTLYFEDLQGEQKYIKDLNYLQEKLGSVARNMSVIDTGLNPSGRMKEFMDSFGIKAPMQNHTETTKIAEEELKEFGRYHRHLMKRLIDTDGKVYHMDYARIFPTEIQLNIPNKDKPAPKLANTVEDFVISQEIINRPEIQIISKVDANKQP